MADPLQAAIQPTPVAAPGAAQAPVDPQRQARRDSWSSYFQRPEIRAALLQFGVGMLQPRGVGQTFAGQVGQSIGDAGQAAARVGEQQRQIAQDAREQQRLDLAESRQAEQLAMNREELDLAKGTAKRQDAAAAAAATQQGIDNDFKRQELALKASSQKSLDRYYTAIAGRPVSTKSTLPPGYQEALDVAKTNAALEDDPLASFFAAKSVIDQQFGLTAGAPSGNATTATGPVPPKAGEVRDGWKFKGGDPSQQSSWEKVK